MNTQIVAILIAEGGKLLGHFIRNRPIRIKTTQEQTPEPRQEVEIQVEEDSGNGHKATEVATGCVPCAIGHIGTCSGLLNEAMRFAKKDGMDSTEVIDRMGMCLDELNAMERVDLRPELTAELPEWEKTLANDALVASRGLRHGLEETKTVNELEKLAATTQAIRTRIGRGWFKQKLGRMSTQEKEQLHKRVMDKIEDMVSQEPEDTTYEESALIEEPEE